METSIFAFPTDLLGEGVEPVLDNVQGRAGLGGVTFHALRRPNAAGMVLDGVALKTAQTRLGAL